MEFQCLDIPDVILITPRVFEDERGYFFESYKQNEFAENGINVHFVQDNRSRSKKGVLRGLHFQKPPHAQDKLVSVTRGEILDVAVDIRIGSPTYGKHVSARLSDENHQMLFIPKGFAHGFLALSDITDMQYKVSDIWDAASEGGIIWNDPDLGIDWGIEQPILAPKDLVYSGLKDSGKVF
ncbi:MAG: dTDP-4-dehydrorhamnose 3,5-epimerase [Patescibacteria group bacterium]